MGDGDGADLDAPAAGRSTRTAALPARGERVTAPPLQRQPGEPAAELGALLDAAVRPDLVVQRDGDGRGASTDDVAATAAAGVGGSGHGLPFLDAIQTAFGRHDVTGVRAHTDDRAADAARAIGARAYATGSDVAFAGAPDLHTAAHEAAHVVQQRGGVQLAGGVGQEGDRYEQHADAVADRVVRGESAEATLDALGATAEVAGDASPPAVQRVSERAHQDLLLDDQREIRAGQEKLGCAALRNAVVNMLRDQAAAVLAPLTEDKQHWPIDFGRLLQECRQTKGHAGKCTALIAKAVDSARVLVEALAVELEALAVGREELQRVHLPQLGYARTQAAARAFAASDRALPFPEFARLHALESVPAVDLRRLEVTPRPPSYERVPPSRDVLDSAARTAKEGAPMPPNGYIERHFSRTTMEFLLAHADVGIHVLEGTVNDLLAHARGAGFTHLHRLEDNPQTDFIKYTARDVQDGRTCVLVLAPSGDSYRKELLAHFTHYQDAERRTIDPGRVQLLRLHPQQAEHEFEQTLAELALPAIDVLVLGKVDDFGSQLKDRGINPLRVVRGTNPPVYGKVFAVNGKVVLSLAIEPGLYAGRAGAFLRVLLARHKAQAMIFAGTAGGLDPSLQVQDIVAPTLFTQVDQLDPSLVIDDQPNHAVDVLAEVERVPARHPRDVPAKERKAEAFFGAGVTHGAVDSILLEDLPWFATHRRGLTVVEQEVTGLLAAARDAKAKLNSYVFLTVSDVLGRDTFDQAETHQAAPAKHRMGGLMMRALERELGRIDAVPETGFDVGALKLELSTEIPRERLKRMGARLNEIGGGLPKLEKTEHGMTTAQEQNPDVERGKKLAAVSQQILDMRREKTDLEAAIARLELVLEARDVLLRQLGPLLQRLAQLHPKQAVALEANLKDAMVDSAFKQPTDPDQRPAALDAILLDLVNLLLPLLQRHGQLVSQLTLPLLPEPKKL